MCTSLPGLFVLLIEITSPVFPSSTATDPLPVGFFALVQSNASAGPATASAATAASINAKPRCLKRIVFSLASGCLPAPRVPQLASLAQPIRCPRRRASPLLLRLHYGLLMLQLGDRVGMAMDELPDAVLGPEDASAPKGDRRRLLPSPDLRLEPLELDGVAEVIAFDLREALELDHPAVAIVGCCPVHGLLDLRLAPYRRTEGVRQGRILGIAEQLEEPARVALSDLIQRAVVRLDRLIEALGR